MTHSIHNQVFKAILAKDKGALIFPADFSELGSSEAVRKVLSRLAKEKLLIRLAHGIYLYPKYDPELGTLYPAAEEIAEAIAQRDQARITPVTGVMALYKLGLSTQVPVNLVYLTNGTSRKVRVGKSIITFKVTAPKNLALKGIHSTLVIRGLQELGRPQVDGTVRKQIKKALAREDAKKLRHDASMAPAWIEKLILSLLKELENDRMVKTDR